MKKKLLCLLTVLAIAFNAVAMTPINTGTTEKDRTAYRELDHSKDELIADALRNCETEFIGDEYGLSGADFAQRISYVYFTNSNIVGINDISTFYLLSSGTITSMQVTYVDDYDAYLKRLQQVRAEVDALMPENPTELEIVHILHDYIVATSAYDFDAGHDKVTDYSVFYASGVYKNHYAVCRGIAHAYKYLLDLYGIDNAIAESTAYNHVWNLVRLGGEWYHIDCTADESEYDILGEVGHDYFLISTDTLLSRNAQKSDFTVLYKDLNLVFTDSTCATDKTYESEQPWIGCHTVCHYYNGSLYTVHTDNALYKDGKFFYQPPEHMKWHPNGIIGAEYTNATVTPKITAVGKDLYMNTPHSIYYVNLDQNPDISAVVGQKVFVPESTAGWTDPDSGEVYPSAEQIYGLNRMEGRMYISIEKDLPQSRETWTHVPGFDLEYELKEPAVPMGLIDPSDKKVKDTVSLTSDIGKEITVGFSGLSDGEVLNVLSDNPYVADATVSDTRIIVKAGIDGTAVITVSITVGNSVKSSYTINVCVNKNYKNSKTVTVTATESISVTDESGDYSGLVNRSVLDESIATVKITGVNTPAIPGTPGGFTKITSYENGSYVIGYESGSTKYYLKASGSTLSAVTDKAQATSFTFAGNASAFTIKSGSYYLTHGSKLALSTSSSNSEWGFDGGKIFYSKKSITRTYKYYLRYSNKSFTVSNSTSAVAGAYANQTGTPDIPGETYTKLDITGISSGKTHIIVGDTLYTINVERLVGTQEITVHTVDDIGVKLAEDYTICGKEGDSYKIQPIYRYGYITPGNISGKYTSESNAEISLVYTLNTDKTALTNAICDTVSEEIYTESSFASYQTAVKNGKKVSDNNRATQSEVDSAVKTIADAKSKLVVKTFTVTVNIVDNFGTKIADTEYLSGEIGTGYTVTPKTISGYITPKAITGTFTSDMTITLTYTLNTDKSALANELNNVLSKGEYTDDSYTAYTNALDNGRTVYNNERATQAQTDAAVKTITDAKAALKIISKVSFIKDTDGINSGSEYVITRDGKALTVENGKITYVTVTDSGNGIGNVSDSSIWVITKYGSSTYYLMNKATGQYLTTSSSGSIFSKTYSLSLTSSKTTWTVTKNGSYIRFAKSSRYITYSGSFGLTTSKSSNTDMTMYVKQ